MSGRKCNFKARRNWPPYLFPVSYFSLLFIYFTLSFKFIQINSSSILFKIIQILIFKSKFRNNFEKDF